MIDRRTEIGESIHRRTRRYTDRRRYCLIKPTFHYADFPETSPDVMEFGLKETSRLCRGRHGEVGIVECGLKRNDKISMMPDDDPVSVTQRQTSSVTSSPERQLFISSHSIFSIFFPQISIIITSANMAITRVR